MAGQRLAREEGPAAGALHRVSGQVPLDSHVIWLLDAL